MQFEIVLELALILLLIEALYQFSVSLYGLGNATSSTAVLPQKRFAIFIPAHNEEAVIGANVRSLTRIEYPPDLYDIYVIADHCTDATVARAREAGGLVLRRDTGQANGKPGALNWAWNRLAEKLEIYDAFVIVDADNVVSPNFLAVMNRRLLAGERVIQGNLDVKNPEDSWVTRAIAIAYWATGRTHQLARETLGWCVALGGTGICIERRLLARLGWDSNSLTEDLDFQARALLEGIRTTWAHETRVYDEKPTTLQASFRQRLRWMRGHIAVAVNRSADLIVAGVSRRSWACLDAVLYLLQPFKLVLGFVSIVTWILWVALGDPHFRVPSVAVAAFGFLYLFHLSQYLFWGVGVLALLREKIPTRLYVYYFHALVLGLTWLIVVIVAMVRPRGSWIPTRHTARVEIDERMDLEAEGASSAP